MSMPTPRHARHHARLARFRARTAEVFRTLRARDWIAVAAAAVIGTLVAAALLTAVVDAARVREQATRQLEAQAAQGQDIRAAQSQRIDGLLADVQERDDRIAAQEAVIAAQSQALADLTEQLRRADLDPITGDPAQAVPCHPRSRPAQAPTGGDAGADQAPTSPGSQPSARPAPGPTPAPAPQPAPEPPPPAEPDPLVCLLGTYIG